MTACVDFHTQLASIMDVLAKAAVADIYKLVEDGYAVLRLEVSRSQRENQMLKKRLQVMEMMVVERGGGREGLPVLQDELIAPGEDDQCPGSPRPLESPATSGTWTDLKRVEKPGDEEGSIETQAIKEERVEVDLGNCDFQDLPKISEDKVVKLVGDDAGRSPVVASQTRSSKDTNEIPGHQSSTFWEGGGPNALYKAEPGNETVNHRSPCLGLEHGEGELKNLGYNYVLFERPSQTETFCTKEMVDVSTDADLEGCPAHSENPVCLTVAKHVGSSLDFLNVKPGDLMMNSTPLEVEVEIRSAWKKDTLLESMHPQQRHYGHNRNKDQS